MQLSGRLTNTSAFELFISLSYSDKADAEAFKQTLVKQALENGGSVYSEDGDYTTLTGKIILKSTGFASSSAKKHYKIGIETDATQFAILPFKSKSTVPAYKTTDGLAYEVRIEELKQRKLNEKQAKQDEAARNLKKFAAEIKSMTELESVLRSFVRYSNKRTDKEKLALVAIKKIHELS
jgi:hypothetical protein